MLRHPAPWIGLVLTVWWASRHRRAPGPARATRGWSRRSRPLLLGISLAASPPSPASGCRSPTTRRWRRRTATWPGCSAGSPGRADRGLVVAGSRCGCGCAAGCALGDEPGRTAHAYYSTARAAAAGAARRASRSRSARRSSTCVRQPLVAAIVLFLYWFLVGGPTGCSTATCVRWLTPLQVQPVLRRGRPDRRRPHGLPAGVAARAAGRVPGLLGPPRRLPGARGLARPLPGRADRAASRPRCPAAVAARLLVAGRRGSRRSRSLMQADGDAMRRHAVPCSPPARRGARPRPAARRRTTTTARRPTGSLDAGAAHGRRRDAGRGRHRPRR